MSRYLTCLFFFLALSATAQRGIPLPPQPVKTDLCAVYDTLIYVLQRDSGLFVSNGSSTRPVQANIPISAAAYYALANQTDTLWVGTSNGLFRVLPSGTVNQFSTAQGNFAADTVFSLAASGNLLYAGTNVGVLVYNGSTWAAYNTTNSGLTSNRVTRVKAQGQRLGIIAGGAAHILSNSVVQALTVPSSLPLQFVQPLPNGELLVATTFTTFVRSIAGNYDSIVATALGDAYVDGANTLLFASPRLWTLEGSELHFRNIDFVSLLGGGGSVFRASKSLNNSYYFMGRFNIVVLNRLNFVDDKPNSFNRRELDINQVKALYLNGGDMFWDRGATGNPRYNVPKQTDPNGVARHSMFAFSPWFGGMHGGQLYQSAQTYRQSSVGGVVFRSGPLTANGDTVVNNGDYDRLWKINRRDIEFFKDAWNRGTVQNGGFWPVKDIREWPGNRPGGGILAPYFDRNSDGQYRWQDGDYPLIKGDQAVWMVYNDKDTRRTQTAAAMEIEVQCMAYAFTCTQLTGIDSVLNYTTFLDYRVLNRSSRNYTNSFITFWADGDLGNSTDDFVGMDVKGNGYYFYNGDNDDEGIQGYGLNPPAQGIYMLKGPAAPPADGIDNNRNGVIDESGEDVAISSFIYFNNDGTPIGNPTNSQDFYNYSRAIWKDNTPMVYGGSGYPGSTGSTTLPAKFMFPGTTDSIGWGLGGTTASPVIAPFQWTETNPGPGASPNVPADRRGLVSMGPFNLNTDATQELTVALVYSRGNNGAASSRLKLLNQDAPRIKQWFAQGNFPSCLDLTGLSIRDMHQPRLQVNMYPNPSQGRVTFSVDDEAPTSIELFDMQGRKLLTQHFAGETTYHLSVEHLPVGLYMVHVKQEKGMATLKLLLQR
ncbi:MAG: hypothetical protein C0424_12160 [Sphingobacteriaceae bacterium]|nr:hypothetical protein [Sphingobacteriaceae bacterium]